MNVDPSSPFEAVIDTGTPGLGASIGLEVNDNLGGIAIAFTTGAREIAAGVYSISTLTAPATIGQYTIVWRVASTVYGVEDLVVTTDAPVVVPVPPPVGGQGMSGYDLITEFLADKRFGTNRTRVLRFLNYRYTELLGLEEWAFLQVETPITLSAATVSAPSDMGIAHRLWLNDDGEPLAFLNVSTFGDAFVGDTSPGRPSAWTVSGANLLIGPTPDTAYPATLYYQSDPLPLADNQNPSVLPPGTEEGLVAGAQAVALELENDPTGAPLEARFQRTIDSMRRRYLTTGRAQLQAMPRDPLAYR